MYFFILTIFHDLNLSAAPAVARTNTLEMYLIRSNLLPRKNENEMKKKNTMAHNGNNVYATVHSVFFCAL